MGLASHRGTGFPTHYNRIIGKQQEPSRMIGKQQEPNRIILKPFHSLSLKRIFPVERVGTC